MPDDQAVPEEKDEANVLWNIPAALLLMLSITMLADFARRLLSADPDSLGIWAIALQAAPALLATSSFTDSGWEWMKRPGSHKLIWRFGLSLGVFLVVGPIWYLLPSRLAEHYYERGHALENPTPPGSADPSRAMRDYERAIALDPQLQPVYFNLGVVLEDFYRYDEAAEQYKRAMIADDSAYEQDSNTRDPRPYNNLARILVSEGKPLTALHVAEDGLALRSTDRDTVSALEKNKAWAEYELGFYEDAIKDATLSKSTAGECILGKVYKKLGRDVEARAAWSQFKEQSKADPGSVSVIQPDCQLLAEEANAKR